MKKFEILDIINNVELEVYLGQNDQDNWNIIKKASQNDIWFHLENLQSPHVVLVTNGYRKIHNNTLKYCARLCKEHSKFKYHNKLNIIYTEIKNISLGNKIGSVITKKTKRLKI